MLLLFREGQIEKFSWKRKSVSAFLFFLSYKIFFKYVLKKQDVLSFGIVRNPEARWEFPKDNVRLRTNNLSNVQHEIKLFQIKAWVFTTNAKENVHSRYSVCFLPRFHPWYFKLNLQNKSSVRLNILQCLISLDKSMMYLNWWYFTKTFENLFSKFVYYYFLFLFECSSVFTTTGMLLQQVCSYIVLVGLSF